MDSKTRVNLANSIPSRVYVPLPTGKTFWNHGQYDNVVKRLENGKRALDDFLFMVEERAAIERRYADKLQSWYNKWSLSIKQGPEYGDIQTVWQSILNEGKDIADIHFRISSKLGLSHSQGVKMNVKKFKKLHYQRAPLLNELKEVKDCKDAFKNIQAPYRKAVENINKYKKKYFEASKNCMLNTNKDGVSVAKLDSLSEAMEKAKSKYNEALQSFNENIRETYTNEMRREFQKYQDLELERVKVLLNSLHDYIGIVDPFTHTSAPLSNIYREAMSPLSIAQPEKDVLMFSTSFGSDMPQNFPKFVDAFSDPVKSELQTNPLASILPTNLLDFKGPNLLLTRLKHLKSDSHLPFSPRSNTKDFLLRRPSHADSLENSARDVEFQDARQPVFKLSYDSAMVNGSPLSGMSLDNITATESSQNHYHLNNVYVRGIANFHSTHKNHLEITKGEVIYQLRGDKHGWCYGRIAYKEGVYPSKAVKLLTLNVLQ